MVFAGNPDNFLLNTPKHFPKFYSSRHRSFRYQKKKKIFGVASKLRVRDGTH